MDLNIKLRNLCAELGDARTKLRGLRKRERELEAEIDHVAGLRNAMVAEQQAAADLAARVATGVQAALAARKRKPKEKTP